MALFDSYRNVTRAEIEKRFPMLENLLRARILSATAFRLNSKMVFLSVVTRLQIYKH